MGMNKKDGKNLHAYFINYDNQSEFYSHIESLLADIEISDDKIISTNYSTAFKDDKIHYSLLIIIKLNKN